jgi:hypothetical protein
MIDKVWPACPIADGEGEHLRMSIATKQASLWAKMVAINHLIGGAAALLATGVGWWQLGKTLAASTPRDPTPDLAPAPPMLVIIPARNEALHIRQCLDAIIGQTVAPVGIWVVDDASTDGTDAIVRAYAQRDARVHLVRGEAPPTGWAGKNWALHQGLRAARATFPATPQQWLLLLDADTILQPEGVRVLLRHAETHHLALVSLLPQFTEPAWQAVALRAAVGELYSFYYMLNRTVPPAFGQCMLLQRRVYEASGGFDTAPLRGALDDDRALAQRVQAVGGQVGALTLPGYLTTEGYTSLAAAWQGHAHHIAPLVDTPRGRRRLFFALVACVSTLLWPCVGLVGTLWRGVWHGWRPRRLALARWGLQVGALTLMRGRAGGLTHLPRWYPFAAPWGNLLLVRLLIPILWRGQRGAVIWKGRRYPAPREVP